MTAIPRRHVKRGAPPVIKPRRPYAKRSAAGKPVARVPELVPEIKDVELPVEPGLDEAALAEAAETTDLGDAAPEETAELEAAIAPAVAEEEPEPAKKAVPEESAANFLAMYFQEMAELDVLRPEEEFRQAREIEQLEIALWDRVFAYAPVIDHVLKVVERTIENSLTEFRPLRRALGELKRSPARGPARVVEQKVARLAHKVSERLRAMDIDKRILEVVLAELGKISTGEPGRVVEDRLAFAPRSPAFRRACQAVNEATARAQRAKNEFVKANLRLVVSIARRFNHGRMPLADLIQEGNIGLIKAVERFDYRRGYRFSTYASWWIRHAISRALADKGRAVRLPVHMIDAYHRVAKSKRELTAKLARQPTSEEIGAATGIAPAKIEKMRSYLLDQSFSLDRPVSDEDGRRFIDFIQNPEEDTTSPVEALAQRAMTDEVRHLLAGLKPIEADILRQRFGLDDDRELTLKEIGEKYNLSRERIRQLQEQALLKMRRALQRKDLM